MYEELQQKRRPRIPKSIRVGGIRGILGVLSPAKFYARRYALDQTEEEKRYFREEQKYRLYKRRVSREEWRAIYRQYRRAQHPEMAREWERKKRKAEKETVQAIKKILGEL